MQPVFADPKTDFVFKRIFGAEGRKPLLIALLNHLLELDGERRILDVQHLTGEQHIGVAELKLSIVDVKCTDASGRRFVVEMQVLKVEGFEKRVVYNASKAYVMQLRNADEYPALCDVVGVTICNFNLWPDRDEHDGFKVPMLSRWRMQEQHCGERGLPQVQYAFLELPKYAAGDAPETLIDKWAYFFREAKNLNVVPPALSERPFRDALEVARTATFSPEEWEAYERAKMAEQDARGALALARQEGIEEGRQSGLTEGHRSGLVEGKRDALLRLLARAGISLSEGERARIQACADASTLDRWIDSVLGAKTASDVLS
ncbi:Rpn family recombination-promoting nuclease/putative transposase [Sorangium sp. So ce1078]|uniref:Rpn family recombination-promoting nuclease/putative transposase n=1 Tax=Sorangium sp. So ce1078 TaxID=3133329 RepID=UPI003F60A2EA